MLHLLKATAVAGVFAINVLTLSARETGFSGSEQAPGADGDPLKRQTISVPSDLEETLTLEQPMRAPLWVVYDFATGIKTVEFNDGSLHEELFEQETLAQTVLSNMPFASPADPMVTGSVAIAPR